MSADAVRVSPDPDPLPEGASLRFAVVLDGVRRAAFVVRWRGALHAWVNSCRHESLALDAGDGRVLHGDELVCVHHGARYRPDTGACLGGPCAGGRLTPLALERRPDGLWCTGRAPGAGPAR